MRRFAPLALTAFLGACAGGAPPASPVIAPPRATPAPAVVRGPLNGQSAGELVARFGSPTFQVREGPGLKLQWSSASCVLDVYLYPPVGSAGEARALHADARRPDGNATDAGGCARAIEGE